jgi:hypothetical protein
VKKGDLIKIVPRNGGVTYTLGIFLEMVKINDEDHWVTFFIDDKLVRLYLFDYNFEVINENR